MLSIARLNLSHKKRTKGKIIPVQDANLTEPGFHLPSLLRLKHFLSKTRRSVTQCDLHEMLSLLQLDVIPWHLPLTGILFPFDLSRWKE